MLDSSRRRPVLVHGESLRANNHRDLLVVRIQGNSHRRDNIAQLMNLGRQRTLILRKRGVFQCGFEAGHFVGHIFGTAAAQAECLAIFAVGVHEQHLRADPTLGRHVGMEGNAISELVPASDVVATFDHLGIIIVAAASAAAGTRNDVTIAHFHGG